MSKEINQTINKLEAIFEENNFYFENFGSLHGLDETTVELIKNLIEEVKRNQKEIDMFNKSFITISFIETQIAILKEKRDKTESGIKFYYYNNFIQAYEELLREYRRANDK